MRIYCLAKKKNHLNLSNEYATIEEFTSLLTSKFDLKTHLLNDVIQKKKYNRKK